MTRGSRRRSQRSLDWLNFFVADVQTGFGPFVVVYLTTQAWTEVEIGFALSLGTLTAMISQMPAGALVDSLRDKRRVAIVALIAIALSAVLLAAWPALLPVYAARVLHGAASCILNPSIAAISLALVGRAALGERLGRNARYASLGGAISAGAMGLIGTYLSPASVFWVTAALALPSIVMLMRIEPRDLDHGPTPAEDAARSQAAALEPAAAAPGRAAAADDAGAAAAEFSADAATGPVESTKPLTWRDLLSNRAILIFAACAALFTMSNAAMLPIASSAITRRAGDEANLIIAACIVLPQLVVVAISPWVGRLAQERGRRYVLLIGFAMLPLRGFLLAVVDEPMMLTLVQALDGISAATLNVMLPLMAADLTRGTNRFNLCLGFFGLAVSIGGTISTTLGGAVASWTSTATAMLVLAGIGMLCFLLAWAALPETRDAAPAGERSTG